MVNPIVQRGTTLNAEPIIISELQVNEEVHGWLFAEEVQKRTAKNGRPFRQLKLRDQRGNEITGRQFDLPHIELHVPQDGKVVLIEGLIEEFQNITQIKLTRAELDETAPADLFVIGTRRNKDQLEEQLRRLMKSVQYPGLQALLYDCFTADVIEQFRPWPAAVRHHGAVVGGPLEHTVNVTLIAESYTRIYPCNKALVLTGALLHDIGKLEELEEQIGGGFTVTGNMFGHIILGVQLVHERATHITELDDATCQDLLHIILAHHGTKEYGSPVCPVTIEALIVHLADMAEAKFTGFLDHCDRTSTAEGWTTYSKEFGGPIRKPSVAQV
jgi:3'-5' exoribonuclease